MKPLAALVALPLALAVAPPQTVQMVQAPQASTVEITEWKVPWEKSRPRDPYVGTDHRVWFVGQVSDYVASLDPATGAFERYELEPGTGPHNLIVDRRGQIWYAGNRTAHIGRLDPATRKITRYPMPDPAARDPHTLVFDRAGDIWFTAQGGNFVGRLTVATGKIDLVRVPTPNARPYGIVVDAKNHPWFNEFGSDKLATVDPATMRVREYRLPDARARGRRIAIASDGGVWYADYARGYLGRLDPATGAVREWPMPAGAASLPYAMTIDDRDRLWLVETGVQPNRLVGFDPKTGRFFSSTEIASGGGTVRHMIFHAPTHELWFGTDANTIARARIAE